MRRPTIGLIIFGVIFIFAGLRSLGGTTTYFASREVAPDIHEAVMTKIVEAENLIKGKGDTSKDEKIAKAQKQLQQIKNEMAKYKEKYINGILIPAPMILFIVSSLITALILIYTGVSILQMRPSTRKWISVSYLAGFLCSLIFLWSAAQSVAFITNLSDRFAYIMAAINGTIYSKTSGVAAVMNVFLSAATSRMLITFYMIFLIFMSITSMFFGRRKIKEIFNQI